MKVQDKIISSVKKKQSKLTVNTQKKDFSKIVKEIKNEQKKVFNVYAIAEKIANGESVSNEELTYIRENAPALLKTAEMQAQKGRETQLDKNQAGSELKINVLG